jgi:hypothetical protein
MVSTPKPQQPAPNPMYDTLAQQAANDQLRATTQQAMGDQASLIARYGTRLAMAGQSTGSPLVTSPSFTGTGRVS